MEKKLFAEADRVRVPLLNGTNYFIWSKKIELVLTVKGLWKYVDGSTDGTSSGAGIDDDDNDGNSKEAQALAFILLSIEDSFLSPVIAEKDPVKVWKILSNLHSTSSEAQIEALQTKMYEMKMEHKEGVQVYANRIMDLRNKFASAGQAISDKDLNRTFFRCLSHRYKVQATVTREIAKSFNEAVSHMVAAEVRDNLNTESTGQSGDDLALLVTPRGNCQHCGRQGHQKDNCFHNPHCSAYERYFKSSRKVEDEQDSDKGLVSYCL